MKFASGNNWGADKALSDAASNLSMIMEKYENNSRLKPNAVYSRVLLEK